MRFRASSRRAATSWSPPTTLRRWRLLIAENLEQGAVEAVRLAMQQAEGAYSLAILTTTELIGVRDPYGVRPLCLGR